VRSPLRHEAVLDTPLPPGVIGGTTRSVPTAVTADRRHTDRAAAPGGGCSTGHEAVETHPALQRLR
jgi:hypothetical protein